MKLTFTRNELEQAARIFTGDDGFKLTGVRNAITIETTAINKILNARTEKAKAADARDHAAAERIMGVAAVAQAVENAKRATPNFGGGPVGGARSDFLNLLLGGAAVQGRRSVRTPGKPFYGSPLDKDLAGHEIGNKNDELVGAGTGAASTAKNGSFTG